MPEQEAESLSEDPGLAAISDVVEAVGLLDRHVARQVILGLQGGQADLTMVASVFRDVRERMETPRTDWSKYLYS